MSIFFRKIENEEEFQEFVKDSMETDMYCAGCNTSTKNRAMYISKGTPCRQILYGLCLKCQEKCLKSKEFARNLSEKVSKCIEIENN
jgi:hypothetical protein